MVRDLEIGQPINSEERSEAADGVARESEGRSWLSFLRLVRQDQPRRRPGFAEIKVPYYFGLLAEAYRRANQTTEGLIQLSEALELVERTGERWYEGELCRLNGEMLIANADRPGAEPCFSRALAEARRKRAKLFELRAATSLARLWRDQDKPQQARELLAPVYGWFTEGFDTLDLKEAKALLEALPA